MYKIERKTTLFPKPSHDDFIKQNALAIGSTPDNLGGNITATNKILAHSDELRYHLRSILGINPDSVVGNWDVAVRTYFDGISVTVGKEGKKLNTSLIFDVTDVERSKYIDKLDKEVKESDEVFAKHIMATYKEEEYYKFARAEDATAYLIWRYAMLHGEVSNNIEDVGKAARIRFYLYTDAEAKAAKTKEHNTIVKVMGKLLDTLKDAKTVKNVLYALAGYDYITVDLSADTLKDEVLCGSELKRLSERYPKEFLEITDDKDLTVKAGIEKLIKVGILSRIVDTSIITDGTEKSEIIGRNMSEAVAFWQNEINRNIVNTYTLKYKNLVNTNK